VGVGHETLHHGLLAEPLHQLGRRHFPAGVREPFALEVLVSPSRGFLSCDCARG